MSPKTTPQKIPRLPQSNNTQSNTSRWQALLSRRDTTTATTTTPFVYGVLTTRIYCRPSCPARLARRANITFYDTSSQAEAAGFRPCKRCKPEAATGPTEEMVQRACRAIEEGVGVKSAAGNESENGSGRKDLKLGRLASEAGLTTSHFHRVFKKVVGLTPGEYAVAVRKRGMLDSSGFEGAAARARREGDEDDRCWSRDIDMGTAGIEDDGDINSLFDPGIPIPVSVPVPVGGNHPETCYATGEPGWETGLWNEFDFLLAAENEDHHPTAAGQGQGQPGQGMEALDELFLPAVEIANPRTSGGGEVGAADSMLSLLVRQ